MMDVDGSCQLLVDSQPKSVCLVWGLAATRCSVCIHQMNRLNSRNGTEQWWHHHKYHCGYYLAHLACLALRAVYFANVSYFVNGRPMSNEFSGCFLVVPVSDSIVNPFGKHIVPASQLNNKRHSSGMWNMSYEVTELVNCDSDLLEMGLRHQCFIRSFHQGRRLTVSSLLTCLQLPPSLRPRHGPVRNSPLTLRLVLYIYRA